MKYTTISLTLLVGTGSAGCGAPCTEGIPGHSDVDFPLADGGSGERGSAAGVWQVTLSPNPSYTTCVDARDIPPETWGYTLEFKQLDEATVVARLLIGTWVMVQDGQWENGTLFYETPSREDLDQSGNSIVWKIVGTADLASDSGVNQLTWTGVEQIEVEASDNPDIPAGCVFQYDVLGEKVCDE